MACTLSTRHRLAAHADGVDYVSASRDGAAIASTSPSQVVVWSRVGEGGGEGWRPWAQAVAAGLGCHFTCAALERVVHPVGAPAAATGTTPPPAYVMVVGTDTGRSLVYHVPHPPPATLAAAPLLTLPHTLSNLHHRDEVGAIAIHPTLPVYGAVDDDGCVTVSCARTGTLLHTQPRAHGSVGTAIAVAPAHQDDKEGGGGGKATASSVAGRPAGHHATAPPQPVAFHLLSAACDQRVVCWLVTAQCVWAAGARHHGSMVGPAGLVWSASISSAAVVPLFAIAPGTGPPIPLQPIATGRRGGGHARGGGKRSAHAATPPPISRPTPWMEEGGSRDEDTTSHMLNPPFPHSIAVMECPIPSPAATTTHPPPWRFGVAYGDGSFAVYDGGTGSLLARQPDAHTSSCTCIVHVPTSSAIPPPACTVVTMGNDKQLRVWQCTVGMDATPPTAGAGVVDGLAPPAAMNITPGPAMGLKRSPNWMCGVGEGLPYTIIVADTTTLLKEVLVSAAPSPSPPPTTTTAATHVDRAAAVARLFAVDTSYSIAPGGDNGMGVPTSIPSPTAGAAVATGNNAIILHPTAGGEVDTPGVDGVAHEIMPGLWLGAEEARHRRFATRHAIVAVVDCMPPGVGAPPHKGLTWYRCVGFADTPCTDLRQAVVHATHAVAEAVHHAAHAKDVPRLEGSSHRRPSALVHCAAGVSRSATVCMAYLIIYHRMTLLEAATLVKSRRGMVYPNAGFWHALIDIERRVHGANTLHPADVEEHHHTPTPPPPGADAPIAIVTWQADASSAAAITTTTSCS